MKQFLGKYSPQLYALMRVVMGAMYMMHGVQKIFGFPENRPPVPYASLFGAGGFIELIAGLLIVIGLFTSPAAFIASGEMAVAYFMFHFPESFWPTINHGEIVIANCFVFLYIAAQGGGMCSLDSARRR